LTEAVNGLKGAVERLEAKVLAQKTKLDEKTGQIADKLSGVTHKIYAAGVVLALLVAVGGFIVNKAVDVAIARITPPAQDNHVQPAQNSQTK
jgi:hypothetical protein